MPGFSGGTGFGSGGGFFGGGYSNPASYGGFGGLGSSLGSQGLPYGQGFNQITGAPIGAINQATYAQQQQQAQNSKINQAISDFLKAGSSGAPSQSAGYAPVSFAPQSYGPTAQAVSLVGSGGGIPTSTPTGSVQFASNPTNGLRTSASPSVGGSSAYTDILQSYADMEAALDGQGQSQLADIARRYGGYEGKTVQNAISRGLAPQYAAAPTFESGRAGTPLASMLRGLRYDQEAANRAAMEGINSQRANITQQRLSAAERMQQSLAQQQYQAAQLDLERQRLAQQDAQFKASLANQFRTSVQFGGPIGQGGGGQGGGGRGGGGTTTTTTTKGGNYYDDGARYGGGGPPSGILGGLYGPPSTSGSLDLGGTGGVPYYPTGADNPYGYGEYSFPGMPGGDFAGYGNFDYGLAGWDIGGG